MNRHITVTLTSATVTRDGYGDGTESDSARAYDLVRFIPRASTERPDPRSPAVITSGSLMRRGSFPVMPDDTITITGQDPHIDGTWLVDGVPGQWATGVEVAIKRAGRV